MHPTNNAGMYEARTARLDFYELVATGVFKSVAEIAFLKLASVPTARIDKRNFIVEISFSLRLKVAVHLGVELSAENALDSFHGFFATFSRTSDQRSPMINEDIPSFKEARAERISS